MMRRDPGGAEEEYFSGDLNELDDEVLRRRCFWVYEDADDLLADCLKPNNKLELGRHVFVQNGDLELPERLTVSRGGAIYCTGTITFDGIECESGERLSLISLEKSITSPFNQASEPSPVEADLVALEGSINSSMAHREVVVRGSVACRRFKPADHQAGGLLVYPIEADPTAEDRLAWLRVHVADRPSRWSH